jgi:hypothetical protein
VLASVSFVIGILLAVIVLAVAGRRAAEAGGPAPKPTTLGWCTLAFGLIAVAALALGAWLSPRPNNSGMGPFLISIAFGFAAVLVGIGTLVKRDRHWPTWVGLVAGLVPAISWIIFAAGYIIAG